MPLEAILGVLVAFADAGATKNPVSLDGASGLVPLETMPWRLGVSNVAPIACSASEAAAATAGDAGAGAGMSGPGPGSACAAAGDIAGDSGVAEGGTTCVAGGDGIKAIDGRQQARRALQMPLAVAPPLPRAPLRAQSPPAMPESASQR